MQGSFPLPAISIETTTSDLRGYFSRKVKKNSKNGQKIKILISPMDIIFEFIKNWGQSRIQKRLLQPVHWIEPRSQIWEGIFR